MTGRVLVVDDNPTNARLMQARLQAEYFEVETAPDGPTALDMCRAGGCDIVLLDVMMPGMDGLEVCRRLKRDPETAHIPVIIVTRLDQRADMLAGLEAGADDFLSEPTSTVKLVTRVNSLLRLKRLTDAMMSTGSIRDDRHDSASSAVVERGARGRILVVDDDAAHGERIRGHLHDHRRVDIESDPQRALFKVTEGDYEVVVIRLNLQNADGLRLCAQLRSLDRTLLMPLLVMVEPDEQPRLMRALELGVSDYVELPLDPSEFQARVRTQIRRRRFTERLRQSSRSTMELALTDSLTGVRNRRYLERRLGELMKRWNGETSEELSVLVLDIDRFKSVNDTFGHPAGDSVLREFAKRIAGTVRGVDIVARLGGEEFVVVMPDTGLDTATSVGERLRQRVAGEPFVLPQESTAISVTVSVGAAVQTGDDDSPERLIQRADTALYRAKREGRNRVVPSAA